MESYATMSKAMISAVVLTKNSSKILESCLRSLTWCTEIIIVDDNSTDDTIAIAKKYKAKIYVYPLDNDFSKQRNFGLEKATGDPSVSSGQDWVLFVDSDEVVSPSLRDEIELRTKNYESGIVGYFIKREDSMWGKKLEHGETGDIWLLRLAKKDSGKWQGRVHEVWRVTGKTGRLRNTLWHFPHPSVSEFLSSINLYSTLRAQELYDAHVRVSFLDIILYPKAKFFVNYILKKGFRDGIPGFLVAIMMSFHSFLVRGKLWQLQNTHR